MTDIEKMIQERRNNPTDTDKMIDEIVHRILDNYFKATKSKVKLLPGESK